ncbi:MAG: transposase [Candidatus Scalindua sp.]|nr:transposase [Candidatus Scalindua sp.]
MRSRYRITEKEGIYFVTSTIVEWIPVFTTQKYCDIVIDSLRFCKDHKGLRLYAFVILENHFHLVVSAPELSDALASLKKFTAKEIINALKQDNNRWLLNQLAFFKKRNKMASDFQVWQEGFHPQLILNDKMLIQKVEYIHQNPVRYGLVDEPEHWRYSSARNYRTDDHSIIKTDELPD